MSLYLDVDERQIFWDTEAIRCATCTTVAVSSILHGTVLKKISSHCDCAKASNCNKQDLICIMALEVGIRLTTFRKLSWVLLMFSNLFLFLWEPCFLSTCNLEHCSPKFLRQTNTFHIYIFWPSSKKKIKMFLSLFSKNTYV